MFPIKDVLKKLGFYYPIASVLEGKEIFNTERIELALASAFVFVLWPGTFVQAFTSPLEVILTTFLLVGFYLYIRYKRSHYWMYVFASGLIFGASILVKPTALFMIISIVAYEITSTFKDRGFLKCLKTLFQLIIRNWVRMLEN